MNGGKRVTEGFVSSDKKMFIRESLFERETNNSYLHLFNASQKSLAHSTSIKVTFTKK